MIDHDRLFKELISTFFVEFMELFFPEVLAYVERDSITSWIKRFLQILLLAIAMKPI